MNTHLEPEIRAICVANLRNSTLLRAIRALMAQISMLNLLRPEWVAASLRNA
jgi:hypothetical protein